MSESTNPLPRLGLFVSRFPPPVGFMDGCEIIDCLFLIWWGAVFHDLDIEIGGSPLSSMPRLTSAASVGQTRECVQVVFDACEAERLECVVPKNGQDFRIVPAVWSGSDVDDWESAFVTGEVQWPPADSLSWMNGKPLLFRQDQTTEWLRGLRSPHLLAKPLLKDPAILPQRPYATLSEAVSWLAYGEALDRRTLCDRLLSEHDRVAQYAESESRPEPEAEFGLWFAAYLASLVRLENVHRILRDAMARGDLVGRGRCQFQSPQPASKVMPIPADVFQLSVQFVLENDGIGVDPYSEDPDTDAFLKGANWKDVRFARYDLEHLWGGLIDSVSSVPIKDTNAAPTLLPRFSEARAEAAYQKRVENWPANATPPSRDDDAVWFRTEFGASRNFARKMRNKHTPEGWRSHGRRKTGGI